jgi:aerobic C4-dicarboxylate transport protein
MLILLIAMLMSKGATGFTGAGFVVLAGTLSAMPDIPMAGLALLLGIDPFMQRGRGLINYIGNGVAAIAIAAWEKDLDVAELNRHLNLGPDGDIAVAPNVPVPHLPAGSAVDRSDAGAAPAGTK